MTPILAFLERYLGSLAARIILCLLYASMIVGSCMTIGRLPPEPMRYVDMH